MFSSTTLIAASSNRSAVLLPLHACRLPGRHTRRELPLDSLASYDHKLIGSCPIRAAGIQRLNGRVDRNGKPICPDDSLTIHPNDLPSKQWLLR